MPVHIRKSVRIALMVYWPVLFIATHMPLSTVPGWVQESSIVDKVLHFGAFFVLAGLFLYGFGGNGSVKLPGIRVWVIFCVIVIYGGIDEWLQGYVGRMPDIVDFLADIFGAFAGLILIRYWPPVPFDSNRK